MEVISQCLVKSGHNIYGLISGVGFLIGGLINVIQSKYTYGVPFTVLGCTALVFCINLYNKK